MESIERKYGVGKPCPVCGKRMEECVEKDGRMMADCPDHEDHTTQEIAEAASKAVLLEAVTELGERMRDPEAFS